MNRLSVIAFGLALGSASAILYLGCALVMAVVSRDTSVRFFNSLMHGVDVEPILRESVSAGEVVIGIIATFVLGWLFGAMMAAFYNVALRSART